MKFKKRRASEAPPKIRAFINDIISAPLESIEEPLRSFAWDFDKGDFHHWVELFTHFDSYFEKYIKPRKDLQLEDGFLDSDPPFPRGAVLQILRVTRSILDNCKNKHFYSSYEQHLSSLLACTDADIVEASLLTLISFLKKAVGKCSIRDASLNSKLFSIAQGWGGKEEGLGLTACALENGCDSIACQLGCTLHFEFYALDDSPSGSGSSPGLQIIHLSNVNSCTETDLELLNRLVEKHKVPFDLRFQLLTRLRFARAFSSLNSRQQYMCIRLCAFLVLVQANSVTNDLASFLNSEPEFIHELVSLLSFEDDIPEKMRILSLSSLVALSQDRSQHPTVLSAVTSGGHRGILPSLIQKSINAVLGECSKESVAFAEALLSLVAVLVSSSSGCSALREAGFIPTLLPLLKDTNPQHLPLVSAAVHVFEAFMDYSNPAAALFRDLGGLDDAISRLKAEVTIIENGSKPTCEDSCRTDLVAGTSSIPDDEQPLYSAAMIAHHRRLLLKALLRAISLGTYAPGNTARIYSSEDSLLPQCLCVIFRRAKDFGSRVFSLAASVMSDLIHKDPTSFAALEAAGLPSAFLDAIEADVVCSAEAITCIPQCLDALCLSNNGVQMVKDRNALSCFIKIFTSRTYLRALGGGTTASLSSGLDELMRHASALRGPGVDMLIEILNEIVKIGSGSEAASSSPDSASSSVNATMETDARETLSAVNSESIKAEGNNPVSSDASSGSDISFLPDFVINASRLLESILQNSDTCRIFFEKKGIDVVMQMFTLAHLPLSFSVGQSISAAFKNFSAHHSATLARTVCSSLKEHLKRTNELLASVVGTNLLELNATKQTEVLRCLWSLEGILSLSNSLLKGTATVISELGAGDADVLKDIGRTYRDVLWQISLSCDSKVDANKNSDQEVESTDGASSSGAGRDSDEDSSVHVTRYMNPVSTRSSSHSQWRESDFLSAIRSGEGLSRRSRHGLTRIRGGRFGRLDAFVTDSEVASLQEPSSLQDKRKKSPDVLMTEILMKLASTMRSFYSALVKGFTSPSRRRADSTSLSSAAKNIGAALARVFLDALSFSGHSSSPAVDVSLSVKCRYLGKVVDDIAAITFDRRRRICYTAIVNNLYVSGAFKELLTTFEATSQLLWTLPLTIPSSGPELENKAEGNNLPHSSWLLETLQSYCKVLEFFVNSTLLLSPSSTSQSQLLVQPAAVGLSIGLFPVPRDPESFVRMLQNQVLDVILPLWSHPMFPACNPVFIASILSLVNCIYSGVGDVKPNHAGIGRSLSQRVVPPPDESTVTTIVDMGFSRARAEEALRRVGTNSVEMAMEWLCNHIDDPVQEDDELAQALALSLGNSTETSKADCSDKSAEVLQEGHNRKLPVDDLLSASMKLFHSGDSVAFPLTDLLMTLCNRNKGEDCPKVASYLIQQLRLSPLDFEKESNATATIAHILALLLSEDSFTRDTAAQDGIVSVAIDILKNLKLKSDLVNKDAHTRCTSAVLLILDSLLQSRPIVPSEIKEATPAGSVPDPSRVHASISISEPASKRKSSSDGLEEEYSLHFSKVLGKSTGYLSPEESQTVLSIVCDLLKLHVPGVVMQAVLQLCARLTKTHSLSLLFLENGGMAALFNLPRTSLFSGYDTLASAIVRHLLEDPQTLQTAMEAEIRQVLSGNRHGGRVPTRTFLTSVAPVISRDPVTFMKAASTVCQLETSGGRTVVVLSKEKDKEKDRSKSSATETGLSSNESLRFAEARVSEGPGKCFKGQKRIPLNLNQVLDILLEIVLQFPSARGQGNASSCLMSMDVDEPATNVKGKSKVDEAEMEADTEPERSAALTKVTFVLKLLCDILLMYVHAGGVILKRDAELSQLHGPCHLDTQFHGGIVHHVLNRVLPLSVDKSTVASELREKLTEKASLFLVVLCGRSAEGRRRVINELIKALSPYSSFQGSSMKISLLPDRRVLAFADLVYSILSKSSSSNIPVPAYSPEVAKCMIDGGIIPCLTNILQDMDLDHPDAPKVSNLILKSLEILTRAASASDQPSKVGALNKKKSTDLSGRSDNRDDFTQSDAAGEHNQARGMEQDGIDEQEGEQNHLEGTHPTETGLEENPDRSMGQDSRADDVTVGASPRTETMSEFIQEGAVDAGVAHGIDEIHVNFHTENQTEDGMGDDEDDDMGDEGDEEEEDDEGEEEDEDIAEDGTALMSLADTDMDDHEDEGLGNEYNDEMLDEEDEDDDYHENPVIEVRWREALDSFSDFPALGQSGSGFVDVASETFEGVNVDDLFGFRRPQGFQRFRQTSRPSFDQANTGALQHPLLSRPSGDAGSIWSSGGNISRESGPISGRQFDMANLYMFDAPVLPHDHPPTSLFGDHSAGLVPRLPPPLADHVGMDMLQSNGRRRPGDGRWADDGQPQAGGQASTIAQAVEDFFISFLRSDDASTRNAGAVQTQNTLQQDEQPENAENIPKSELEIRSAAGQHTELQEDSAHETPNSQSDSQHADVLIQDHASAEPSVDEVSGNLCENDFSSGNQDVVNNAINDNDTMNSGAAGCNTEEQTRSVDHVSSSGQHGASEIITDGHCEPMETTGSEETPATIDYPASHHSVGPELEMHNQVDSHAATGFGVVDGENIEPDQVEHAVPSSEPSVSVPLPGVGASVTEDGNGLNNSPTEGEAPAPNGIDPTFLEALPEDLRAEVLASQQSQPAPFPSYAPPLPVEDIDPEFLAALPPDIQAEVLAQQRAQRVAQQSEGQPVDMDNASVIATLPADLREEVLLTSSEAVLSALPSPLLAEAQLLRDRAMSHYSARSIFGSGHRLSSRRNGLGFSPHSVMDRGVGVTIGRRTPLSLADSLKMKEIEGKPLLDKDELKALIRLLRLAQPLSKGLLQRVLLNLCAHSDTRATLVRLLLNMIKPECDGTVGSIAMVNSQRLYGCPSNVVYGRSQLLDGLPPLVLRRVLEALTYLATNHAAVSSILFFFDTSPVSNISMQKLLEASSSKGKEKIEDGGPISDTLGHPQEEEIPFVLFLKLLNRPLFIRSAAHLEQLQKVGVTHSLGSLVSISRAAGVSLATTSLSFRTRVMSLIQVVVCSAAAQVENESLQEHAIDKKEETSVGGNSGQLQGDTPSGEAASKLAESMRNKETDSPHEHMSCSQEKRVHNFYDIFLRIPQTDMCNLCLLLGREGLSDKVYALAGEVLKKLASVAPKHRKFFTLELSYLAQSLCQTAVSELSTLKNTNMAGLSASSMAGAAVLRVLQALSSLTGTADDNNKLTENAGEETDHAILQKLNDGLEPLWGELSECINSAETHLGQCSESPVMTTLSVWDNLHSVPVSTPLPPGTQRLLPFIEAFFVLCEKLQSNSSNIQQDHSNVTATEVKESVTISSPLMRCGGDSQRRSDGMVAFSKFAEKHRHLLNAFIRQNPALLEKSLSMMLKAPRLVDFDNKKAYFRSRIRQQHEHHLTGPLRISVRRAYVLEDSYNQLRMKPTQDLKGRLHVHFQGEEGIDAGGLTREWYQLLSRVIFDKGALLFTTVGNDATFQPNPNSVYQTEHLSYFKFVGRVVAKALYDGQLLDVYFTRSFYKHILGVKVTYHDIEAVDPDYYKNLKWMLENDVSDIPDLTFSMDADEEKLILYEKTEVTDYELKPGGRNIRVTEETKHEYIDLVADHILTNAIRPQINSFLEGFNELVPRELISIFNDKELELLISGLPEIDLDDLKSNTEYTGYTTASNVVQWFWEVVGSFNKEDMARFLQFVTGTSKIPLEGFRALQGISGPQRFQIHKAYGAPERLPSAHTCFNQLDLPEYPSKEQLRDRLLLAIHEASEGFGFG